MPGSATIGTNLVDSLLGMVDELRGDLHTAMGVRQWRVFRVTKTWTGPRRGEGTASTVELEITPSPLVSQDLRNQLTPQGLDEAGALYVSEVSLTYTEDELAPVATALQEILYVLRDAHGQSIQDRTFYLTAPPLPDRTDSIGWILKMARISVEDC